MNEIKAPGEIVVGVVANILVILVNLDLLYRL